MNFQQGFDVFDFIRGQTTDSATGPSGRILLRKWAGRSEWKSTSSNTSPT